MTNPKLPKTRLEDLNFDIIDHRPLLIVISGPSGIGKDTVVKMLHLRSYPFHFVVTVASREPRPGEVHGKDYLFVSKEEFEGMIADDAFAEYSVVYDTYKGVPKAQINAALASGKDVLLRLDVQGAMKIKAIWPQAILIFLIPTNAQEWYERLIKRNSESEADLEIRISKVCEELEISRDFDYAVVNAENDIDKTVDNILAIVTAERMRVLYKP